jgi:hypothetical protein
VAMAKRPELLAGERKDNETDRAVQSCNDYLRMGPARSLSKLLIKYGKTRQNTVPTDSIDTLNNWSRSFDWQIRASAYDSELEQAKNEKRKQVIEQGLALDYERVTKLKKLAQFLEKQIYDEAPEPESMSTEELIGATLAGSAPRVVPVGFEQHKVWLPDVKQVGSGENAERVDIVKFNSALIAEYRSTLADLAAETGGRRQKQEVEHTGKDGGPIQTTVKHDLSRLSVDELKAMRDMVTKAANVDS